MRGPAMHPRPRSHAYMHIYIILTERVSAAYRCNTHHTYTLCARVRPPATFLCSYIQYTVALSNTHPRMRVSTRAHGRANTRNAHGAQRVAALARSVSASRVPRQTARSRTSANARALAPMLRLAARTTSARTCARVHAHAHWPECAAETRVWITLVVKHELARSRIACNVVIRDVITSIAFPAFRERDRETEKERERERESERRMHVYKFAIPASCSVRA